MHLYCRVDVMITDAGAVADHAIAELREADIDWATEEDDLESAIVELREDGAAALAAVADISRILEGVPGVEFRGGRCWAETRPPAEGTGPDQGGRGAGWHDFEGDQHIRRSTAPA
ncbi:hypothetical protein GCM10027290_58370 [Micromonospora sonneratiae]